VLSVDWINVAQHRDQWMIHMLMNLCVIYNFGNLFSYGVTTGFMETVTAAV
jgi:hypothetical protein